MNNTKRCAACRQEKPVSEMKVCMHNQMHRYVCDMKCMNDFYNPPKKTAPEAEPVEVVALISDVGVDYLKAGYGVTVHGERWRNRVALVGENPISLMTVAQHNRIMASAPQHDAEMVELIKELIDVDDGGLDDHWRGHAGKELMARIDAKLATLSAKA